MLEVLGPAECGGVLGQCVCLPVQEGRQLLAVCVPMSLRRAVGVHCVVKCQPSRGTALPQTRCFLLRCRSTRLQLGLPCPRRVRLALALCKLRLKLVDLPPQRRQLALPITAEPVPRL